jgi:predicted glutamine amidotransferase
MCIIVAKPIGAEVDMDTLQICGDNNGDGCGYAFHDGDKIQVRKFLSTEALLTSYQDVVKTQFTEKDTPAILHFRIATEGAINKDNCHPFKISDDLIMAHNGTIKGIDLIEGATDSESFAKNYLSFLTPDLLQRNSVQRLIKKDLTFNKLAFLDSDGRITILNMEKGELDDSTGVWYSNTSYKCYRRSYYGGAGYNDWHNYGVSNKKTTTPVKNVDDDPKVIDISTRKALPTADIKSLTHMRFQQNSEGGLIRGPEMGGKIACCNCGKKIAIPKNQPRKKGSTHWCCTACRIPITCGSCGDPLDDISVLGECCNVCNEHPNNGTSYASKLVTVH